jgi:hypothetical protein
MKELVLTKAPGGVLIPIDPQAAAYIAGLKLGQGVTATVKRHRNPRFHRKFMALLNLAFDHWEPVAATYKGQVVGKNFDQFRRDITILSGHYEMAVNLKGETRLTAKSISFANMSEEEFGDLYNAACNVILAKVLQNYDREQLDAVMDRLTGFL